MIQLRLKFIGGGAECTAQVQLEGIADSWDAIVQVSGHSTIHELRVKFWMGSFIFPVFENRQDAIFFEPLLEEIAIQAKENLPKEFQ